MTHRDRSARFRDRAVLASVTLSVLATVALGAGQGTPRATFDTFLSSMIEAKDGDAAALATAAECLDLGDVAATVRDEAGRRAARDLKTYLDKVERIDLATVPADPGGDRWVYRRDGAGVVEVVLGDDGKWRFSPATIASLPALLESVADRSFVAGIRGGGGGGDSLAGWIRSQVPESLRGRAFVLEGWQWVGLVLLTILGVILDRLVRWIVTSWIRRLLQKRPTGPDVDLVRFGQPVGIFAMGGLWSLTIGFLDLPLGTLHILLLAARFVMVAAGVWAAYRLVDLVSAYLASFADKTETPVDDLLVPLLRRAGKIGVIAFGLVFIAQNLDVDVSSLLAGLGIGGLAFALAAKDTVENLFGSVTVLVDRPFKTGDWIKIDGDLEGTVEELGLRSTRVRTFYNSLITVPNSRLVQAAVDNLGERRYRRISLKLGVQYDTTPEKIEAFCEGIRELIRRHPFTRKDFYLVYFNDFGASSLEILLYCFHEAPDWPTELRERHRLFSDILRLANRLGVEFAFPTRTLHLASTPDGSVPSAEATEVPAEWSPEAPAGSAERGRREAAAIAAGLWGEEAQAPVRFDDPDGLPAKPAGRTGSGNR